MSLMSNIRRSSLSGLFTASANPRPNQLAKHANMGTLEVSPETEKELMAACAEVRAMRADLVAALGLKGSSGA